VGVVFAPKVKFYAPEALPLVTVLPFMLIVALASFLSRNVMLSVVALLTDASVSCCLMQKLESMVLYLRPRLISLRGT